MTRRLHAYLFLPVTALLLATIAAEAGAAPASGPRLVGTVTGAPFSGAVYDDGTGIQTFYRLNEQLPDGSKLIKVRSDSIVVRKSDGLAYEMYLTGGTNAAAGTGTTDGSTVSNAGDPSTAAQPPPRSRDRRRSSRHSDAAD